MVTPMDEAVLERMNARMRAYIPHNRELGLTVVDVEPPGTITMRLPYAERLVGDPETGVLHGGAVTTLLDSASGSAAMLRLGTPTKIATLDLRIDYLKPAPRGRAVLARVECYKVTRSVLFVRGQAAPEGSPEDVIANVTATFMRKFPTPNGHPEGGAS
jgi:uncharacterized protein (TIGR00369 family)